MPISERTVFLTGASGVVGQAILEKLAGLKVVCLVHSTLVQGTAVETVAGDIDLSHFGLTAAAYADLVRRVDYVIHSAATTSFGESREETYRTNLEGTRHVLELAHDAGAPICHISTAFAHLEGLAPAHASNAYESSKLEAEAAVRESGVPYAIVRPSVVVGDSHDGHMSRFQGFHLLCELLFRGVLPVWAPTKPTARMDFVPQDAVADVVRAVVEREPAGEELWVTAGDTAIQVDRAMELWAQHIPRLTGKAVKKPRYVEPDVIDRLVRPVFLPSLPVRLQGMVTQVLDLLSFSLEEPLPTSMPALSADFGVPVPDPETCLVRNAEFWAKRRGFFDTQI